MAEEIRVEKSEGAPWAKLVAVCTTFHEMNLSGKAGKYNLAVDYDALTAVRTVNDILLRYYLAVGKLVEEDGKLMPFGKNFIPSNVLRELVGLLNRTEFIYRGGPPAQEEKPQDNNPQGFRE